LKVEAWRWLSSLIPRDNPQVSEDRFDLIQRLVAKVVDFQQFLLGIAAARRPVLISAFRNP